MYPELLIQPSENKVLTLKMRLTVGAAYLFDKARNSNISEDKKQNTYHITQLLLDSNKVIDEFVEADSKRKMNNFELIYKNNQLRKENEELLKEVETLKKRIPL